MSLLHFTPTVDEKTAVSLAHTLYGLQTTATPLPGERDQNFRLQTASGQQFVLKISNAQENTLFLQAQQQALAHLAHLGFCQTVYPTLDGKTLTAVPLGNHEHLVWLVAYLPGQPMGTVKWHSPDLLHNLGQRLGQLDQALTTFDHPAIHRTFHWDLANGLQVVQQHIQTIGNPEIRQLVEQLTADFAQHTAPLLPQLRRTTIHNDANDYNVLVTGGSGSNGRLPQVTGLIDLGDMVHSFTVADLAIAIAYAILDKPDPLAAAAHIVQGYHAVYPLSETEVAALFPLVCLRLCVSVCLAAHQQQQRPSDEYLGISQQPIRRTLPQLAKIPPRLAEAVLRHACGFPPVAASPAIVNWLKQQTVAPILADPLEKSACVVFDLSIGSSLMQLPDLSEPAISQVLQRVMAEQGAVVGIGRYDEARLLYTTPAFATGPRPTDERRTIHLGIDLFVPPGTPVYAPLAGTVYAFANLAAPLDYGPVIILQHKTDEGGQFFTLYGHLSLESLDGLYPGKPVAQGEKLATIGVSAVNGGWTPHLHLQLITDLLELGVNFPGVGRASQRAVWCSLSPDPALLLHIPAHLFPRREPEKRETLAVRQQKLGRNLSIGYREPVKVVRGWMQYLYDETGRQYVDAYNNVPHVGHCHPQVVRAGQQQMGVLNTNTRYLHDFLNRYAEQLTATLPEPLSVCYFLNSASEANELAIRLARSYTGQRDMIVLEAAYHGNTNTLIDISPYKHDGPGGSGAPGWVHTTPIPDTYRGLYRQDDPQAGEKYASHVTAVIENLRQKGTAVAAYIAETCPSVGGQIFMPPGYLSAVYRAVRQAGGVCIADEVQTGYGRIGSHFWAFEAHGVTPDIVVMGKPIGNGHPIAAVVTTPTIAEAFNNGMEFFTTFGGNTVSCAIGLAVLEVMQQEQLQTHAWQVGERLLTGLRPFVQQYPIVGDVRGSGLFLGVELVQDRVTLQPAAAEATYVANRMRQQGILLGTDGPFHNVVKIRPPMPFSLANADLLVETLAGILAEIGD